MSITLHIIEILFWLCIFAIIHTYILFPIILKLLAKGKNNNKIVYSNKDNSELPKVSIVIAAYNEEAVIEQKIRSILDSSYPSNKIEVLIGSDNSNDNTNSIIEKYAKHNPSIILYDFKERQGKAKIINKLSALAKSKFLILTDANVFFTEDTIYHLVKHYKNDSISLVGGLIKNTNLKKDGISHQEKTYLTNENSIKYREGILWGSMIGAFGGIYSIRKSAFHPVPLNYYMDDFYITMHVLQDGGKAIKEPLAICYEDISNLIKEEYRRKIRISIGNFQNLSTFWRLAFPPFSGLGFCFISHKIFRWLTPFFLLFCLISSGFLAYYKPEFLFLLAGQLSLILLTILDVILKKIHIHIVFLRFITHFYSMNIALLIGFVKFVKGVDTNVWQPTKRNQ